MTGESISHYQIKDQVGRGGMGIVYRAEDTKLNRMVALKLLPGNALALENDRLRFYREARALAALSHPNIAHIYEIDEAEADGESRLFIAMEYVDGDTLSDRIAEGAVSVHDAVSIAEQIAAALQAAHDKGIIHRDMKSSNVMLAESGLVKVLDFGLAKTGGLSNVTRIGTTLGTVAYMSPEQARGEDVDERTDIWSLGVVLYELLSGRLPFEAEYEQAVIYRILNDEPEKVRIHNPLVAQAIADVVQRALTKDREGRFSTMTSFLRELIDAQQSPKSPKTGESGLAKSSIAVLPFSDMSPRRDQDYFCEGVADELITALARIDGLRVSSRTSSFLFREARVDVREIGKRLGVGAVLEGSVRKAGNRLRVTVQLVDTTHGYHLWSKRYDGELEDIFEVQDEIAENTVRALRGVLTDADKDAIEKAQTPDIEAYDYYLRGRQFLHQLRRTTLEHARDLFGKAIEIDPDFAPAYAAIAFCRYYQYQWFGREESHHREADEASERAVKLAPDLGEALVARGLVMAAAERFAAAERAMEKALRLHPDSYDANYFYGRICFMQGKFERAAELFERASELDPLEYQSSSLLSCVYEALGREQEAKTQWRNGLRRAEHHLELNPDDVRAVNLGAIALVQMGDTKEGLAWQHRALSMAPDDPVVVWNAACAHSLAGLHEEAMDYLEEAISLGISNRRWVENDPDMQPLRDKPRFQSLLEKMR